MTEKKLNQLLSMLPNYLVGQLENMSDKREIVETLKAHIFLLREKINQISIAQAMQNLYNANKELSTELQAIKRH